MKTPEQIRQELEADVEALFAEPVDPEITAFVELRESVANHIFEAMQAQNISKAELARRLGTSRAYVSKLLGGGTNVSLDTLARLARVLERDVAVRMEPKERGDGWSDCWDGQAFERPALKQITGEASRRYPWQKSSAKLRLVNFPNRTADVVPTEAAVPALQETAHKAVAA